MGFSTQIHIRKNYMVMVCSGEYKFPALQAALNDLFRKCQETRIFNILLDFLNVTGHMPDMDKFSIGVFIAESTKGKIRMAILDNPSNINRFGETVSRNRGARVKIFTSEKEALSWLLKTRATKEE